MMGKKPMRNTLGILTGRTDDHNNSVLKQKVPSAGGAWPSQHACDVSRSAIISTYDVNKSCLAPSTAATI